jgi:FKBP-type peptidyl-prolyl cis-trans isomerase (trigger factor)
MNTKEVKIEKGTVYLETTIPQDEVDVVREHAVDEMIKNVTVKGFRQGKAPKSIAAGQIDPNKLSNHVLSHIFNDIISDAVKEHKYQLLGRPVLENIDTPKEGGWVIKLQLPIYPAVKLGDYKKNLPKETPAKKTKTTKTESKTSAEEDKLEAIYRSLLDNVKIDVSPLLIEEEVNHSLERLESQAKSLNLSSEDYLKAIKRDLDSVKKEYATHAEESIKLDLILLEIAKEEKIDTSDKELLDIAKVSNIGREQLGQLKSIMNRRKTVDYLLKI